MVWRGIAGEKPRLFQCCGTEDFLYEHNRHFLQHARPLNPDLTYEEEPGTHNWEYWDRKSGVFRNGSI